MSDESDFRHDTITFSNNESRDGDEGRARISEPKSEMCDFRHDTITFSNVGDLTEKNEGRVNKVIMGMDATLITAREKKRSERREQRRIRQECDMANEVPRPGQPCFSHLNMENENDNDNDNNNNDNDSDNDKEEVRLATSSMLKKKEEVRLATSNMLKNSIQRAMGEVVAKKKKARTDVNEEVKEENQDADQEDTEEEEEEEEEVEDGGAAREETRRKRKRKVGRVSAVRKKNKMVAIHLFHKALRLHDNEGLSEAIESAPKLLPLYIFNEKLLDPELLGVNQLDFLLQTLVCLNEQLVEKGSRLFVAIGDPVEIVESLIRHLPVNKLTYERDTNPVQKCINQKIENLARRQKVRVQSYWAYTLFEPDYLMLLDNYGKALVCMNEFVKVISAAGIPSKPISAPDSVPPPPSFTTNTPPYLLSSVPDLAKFTGTSGFGYDLKENKIPYVGGEKAALCRLEEVLGRGDGLCGDNPTSLTPDSTCLSPYISIGALSVRLVYTRVKDTLEHTTCTEPECTNPTCTETAVVLKYQLYRREHTHMFTYLTPDFNFRPNNPLCVCRNIPWLVSGEADSLLKLWEMGRTGYPSVDAVMNQMRMEGWIHHRARELVLSFLTRGGLFIFWKMGMDVLACHLIDHDWCINGYNWHHLSCTAFYLRDFHVHDPVTFFKDHDPTGKYIRKHIPALKDFPVEFIYEPWKAPEDLQKAAKCIIGVDYPKPIVDHEVSSKKNMATITKVVDKHFILA